MKLVNLQILRIHSIKSKATEIQQKMLNVLIKICLTVYFQRHIEWEDTERVFSEETFKSYGYEDCPS